MQQASPFFQLTLDGVIRDISILTAFLFAVYKSWQSTVNKINSVGIKVNNLAQVDSVISGRVEAMERTISESMVDRNTMHERLARLETSLSINDEHLASMKIELLTELATIRALIVEKDHRSKERIVRLETLARLERRLGKSLFVDDDEEDA